MGLFGKKKTPEEILAEGRALYEQGEYGKASLVLLKASGKLHGEVDYWLGRSYLALDAKEDKASGKTAKQYLKFAADAGIQEAAALLAGQPIDEAADADLTADEAIDRGLEAWDRKDYVKTMSCFRRAERLGSTRATLMIGVLFSNGFGFPKDAAKGLQYFLKAAEQGVSDAQLYAAAKYESGADGVPQDLEKAVYWYEKAAEQGKAAAQHNLALLYIHGRGTAQDYEKARYWLQKSAAQDKEEVSEYSKGALAQLEEMMSKSGPKPAPKAKTDEELCSEGAKAYAEKNYAAAVQIWRQLAEKGMARAQDCLALLYYRGDGVGKDEKKSAEWYRKAAEQGYGSSCFNLAIFYERGIGVTEDLNEALRWAEKAKAVGAEKADNLIAEIRHNIEAEENRKNLTKPSAPKPGDELSPEEQYQKGMELFRAGVYDGAYALLRRVCRAIGANKNDYPDGQAAMGWMYEHGCGVEEAKDGMAHRHYEIAARNGDKDGMAGFVRLTAKATSPSLKDCEAALDYAKQLGTSEAKKAVPALEQKLAECMADAEFREALSELRFTATNIEAVKNIKFIKDIIDHWDTLTVPRAISVLNSLAELVKKMALNESNPDRKAFDMDMAERLVTHVEEFVRIEKMSESEAEEENKDISAIIPEMKTQIKEMQSFGKSEKQIAIDVEKLRVLKIIQVTYKTILNTALQYGVAAANSKNYTIAIEIFEVCANLGDPQAQFNYGIMYFNGYGITADKSKALIWYEKAANQGFALAQFNCGVMYGNGEGTAADREKAKAYLQKATAQTDDVDTQKLAKEALRNLN